MKFATAEEAFAALELLNGQDGMEVSYATNDRGAAPPHLTTHSGMPMAQAASAQAAEAVQAAQLAHVAQAMQIAQAAQLQATAAIRAVQQRALALGVGVEKSL